MGMTTYSFEIDGMSCGHCVKAIQNTLAELEGVQSHEVKIGHVTVQADDALTQEAIKNAIEEEGYTVTSAS